MTGTVLSPMDILSPSTNPNSSSYKFKIYNPSQIENFTPHQDIYKRNIIK